MINRIEKLDDKAIENVSGGVMTGKTALFDVDDKGFVHFQDDYGGTLNIPMPVFEKIRAKYAGTGENTARGMECRMKTVPVRDIQSIINSGL